MSERTEAGLRRRPSKARPDWIRALLEPRCYSHETSELEIVETHISWVVLTGQLAYKIKKPVKLAFLDFSTLELRHRFCLEELRLNKRLAPDLYIDVVPIGGSFDEPRVGATPAIEYAIKMRQFDSDLRLDREIARGEVGAAEIRAFAREIAAFHAAEAAVTKIEASRAGAERNVRELCDLPAAKTRTRALGELERWTVTMTDALEPTFARRIADGRYKDCHGDLHLENVVVDRGRLVAFDALEFDRKLRLIDTMNETAFFAMDLMAHERSDLAFVYLTQYLECAGDYSGLATLTYYMVFRALVRAKVCAIKDAGAMQAEALAKLGRYVDLAHALTAPRKPLLVISHGLSGSGKTRLTESLIAPLGAIRIRSDLERKRLLDLPALARTDSPIGGGLYAPEISTQTYDVLLQAARAALEAGFNCIVDAAFLGRAQRKPFIDLARRLDAGIAILDCTAEESVLRDRIERRFSGHRDASEADFAVLDYQLQQQQTLTAAERRLTETVNTTAEIDTDALARRLAARTRAKAPERGYSSSSSTN